MFWPLHEFSIFFPASSLKWSIILRILFGSPDWITHSTYKRRKKQMNFFNIYYFYFNGGNNILLFKQISYIFIKAILLHIYYFNFNGKTLILKTTQPDSFNSILCVVYSTVCTIVCVFNCNHTYISWCVYNSVFFTHISWCAFFVTVWL